MEEKETEGSGFLNKTLMSWEGQELPAWVYRYGLHKPAHRVLFSRICHTQRKWWPSVEDGLGHLVPMLVALEMTPAEAKKDLGRARWKKIHHAGLKVNIDRMLMFIEWQAKIDDVLAFDVFMRSLITNRFNHANLGGILVANRILKTNAPLSSSYGFTPGGLHLERIFHRIRDAQRMGVRVNPKWSWRRLNLEHDAAARKNLADKSDSRPWAAPWVLRDKPWTFRLLTNELDLALEGVTQRHCVKSYAPQCAKGKIAVMQISGPERATMSFSMDADRPKREFVGTQIYGACNTPVSRELWERAMHVGVGYLLDFKNFTGPEKQLREAASRCNGNLENGVCRVHMTSDPGELVRFHDNASCLNQLEVVTAEIRKEHDTGKIIGTFGNLEMWLG